ncbi:NAD(P)H-binding protein [Mucilaginibacter rubeus]|uniref:NAD(P)H-binding protein n=1 Tax=Mucilaginibacter rubeus TaxID=2027860 RepID=A0AAE6JHQ7_9SPHI|nr:MULTISPECIES: NAD(P)H-binding protein [Mucilaginibacter]QEM04982.1 NAD(P)H-binding protein [Mucilaginibacter rubeus]QEM17576.1 NAD(P)H-binding protein [Mucilaginibacter gossypii]QTE45903.1 NAD(P)H-binding protein [Mucilaginibacter rubeus]QTE52500.1 NAD(P)H-binding protein [Mucilaginibacter rubeus]QTE57589.1 NAD(P)H-binding protein [Mucilaginibacter rubeus]
MKIIVTGSLGNISKPLAVQLIAQGHTVTIISTDPGKSQEIITLGATAAIGSVTDAAFLTGVFTGADAVYTMVPPNFAAPDPIAYYEQVGQSYAEAIRASGVKRVVQLSSWGAHLPAGTGIIVGSHRIEQIFNGLANVDLTHLRPASFYTNLYHYVDMIKNSGMIATNYGGGDKLIWVSPLDIAKAAAEELVRPSVERIRYVASDERTCKEVAAVLGAAIGKPEMQWLSFSDDQVKATMEQHGVAPLMAGLLVELNAAIRTGLMREDYDRHPPAMGKIKIEDFAREFALAFK